MSVYALLRDRLICVENGIQTIIDKFYKRRHGFHYIIERRTEELVSTFDLERIWSLAGNIIFSTWGLKHIYILRLLPDGNYRVVHAISHERYKEDKQRAGIGGDSETARLLETYRSAFIRKRLPCITSIKYETIEGINRELEPFEGEAVVPVFVDNNLELLMLLGERSSGDTFSDEDVKLLNMVSHQTAIALKNTRLYQERLQSEKLSSIRMMSATFAHEIRGLLTSLKTFIELLPERYNDLDFRETFKKVLLFDIERINKLITDLTDLSINRKGEEKGRFNLMELVDEIIDYIQKKFGSQKDIVVEKMYNDIKLNIMGYRDKLRQALIGIMNNGCEAMESGGILRVNVMPDGEKVNISISDMGKGIEIDDIERIFEPFYTTKDKGMGLGLAISKKAIEEHGGNIRVQSEPGCGTTFIITLPLEGIC